MNDEQGLSTAAVYDPNTNSLETIPPMNTARAAAASAALGGKFYVVGGGDKTAEVYDPIDKSWNYIASMDVSRAYFGCAALGGKLYAVGGDDWNTGLHGSAFHATVECYDPIHNSWNYIASLNTARDTRAVALGGKLYAVGGAIWDNQRIPTNIVEVYDPMNPSGGWSYSVPLDISRQQHGCAALGGKLYAVMGITTTEPWGSITASVEVYDPSLVPMPQITHQGEDFYVSAQRGGPKTFVIPHPEYEGKMLRHACLEAPTRGTNVYEYQFEATEENQTTTIPLPSYFKHINGRVRVYVSAGKGEEWSGRRGKVNEELTAAIIKTEKTGTFNVMVTGVRKDPEAVAYSATENIDDPIDAKDI